MLNGGCYIITAPKKCEKCGSVRDEETKHYGDEGVIACAKGPCAMKVEFFRCNSSMCRALIHSEGREQHLILLRHVSAATHAFMRHEVYGVACGIGPTSLRLQHYEQKVLESQSCGAIPSKPKTRGVRTLHDMFRLMTQVMTKNPSRELFTCDTCTPFSPSIQYEAVAVDGICAGYPTKFVKPFISVSVPCKPVGPTTSDPTTSRPKCRLLKRSDTMKFLLQAARGENIRVTSRTVRPIMAAFRLLAPFVFLADWSLESICGLSETDFGIEDQIEGILGIVA